VVAVVPDPGGVPGQRTAPARDRRGGVAGRRCYHRLPLPNPVLRRRPPLRSRHLLPVVALLVLGACTSTVSPSPVTPSAAATPTAAPTAVAPTPSAAPSGTPAPSPSPGLVAAVTNGVWLPADQAARATRHPIAVMVDDQADARPQSGLASADIIYQAPAEGGIPRYMLLYQAGDPPSIGPIRSARRYFVAWAAEWRAMYVHVGGAPNALNALALMNGTLTWNADEFRWGGTNGYMWRIPQRLAPHNVYSSGVKLQALAARLGAVAPVTQAAWTFKEPADVALRPAGGSIVVPYSLSDFIGYTFDHATDRYLRRTSSEALQHDLATGEVIAPYDVVVLFMGVAPLRNDTQSSTNVLKHRLEINYLGTGRALVFRDGQAIAARWSKKDDASPTLFTYASGPLQGKPVELVRGQIAIQVVATGTAVRWTIGPPFVDHSLAE
jgi:hypothetical protein